MSTFSETNFTAPSATRKCAPCSWALPKLRQQPGDQHRDNGDDNPQLDESKTFPPGPADDSARCLFRFSRVVGGEQSFFQQAPSKKWKIATGWPASRDHPRTVPGWLPAGTAGSGAIQPGF